MPLSKYDDDDDQVSLLYGRDGWGHVGWYEAAEMLPVHRNPVNLVKDGLQKSVWPYLRNARVNEVLYIRKQMAKVMFRPKYSGCNNKVALSSG